MPDVRPNWAWAPQPGPQSEAISVTWCDEVLYGGAAGGGKSDYLLGDYLQDVPTYGAAWPGVLFRRTYPELQELIARSLQIYPQTGAEWLSGDKEWRWPNGAVLKMRYLERDEDASRYQGHQFAWEGWDELSQWKSDYGYRYLRARLRSASAVPNKRIRATANPGGPGHHWVKQYFIDPAPGGFVVINDDVTKMDRMFIPSRLTDNAILTANDPGYADRLRGLGSPELVRAWLEGDWSVVQGAYFPEWSTDKHVIAPFAIPSEWPRFRSMDWGSARPFSVGWWAVAMDGSPQIPRGCLIRYREWYGASAPNVGLKLTADDVAIGIKQREAGDKVSHGVCDPSMMKEDGGPSIAHRMALKGVHWRAADNSRLAGWDQVRARLRGEGDKPMMKFFSTCVDSIRTLPALQHDKLKAEDVDTDGEDHAGDDIRYACMSRPYTPPEPKTIKVGLRDDYRERDRPQGGSVLTL